MKKTDVKIAWINGTPTTCHFCGQPLPITKKRMIRAFQSRKTGQLYCEESCFLDEAEAESTK